MFTDIYDHFITSLAFKYAPYLLLFSLFFFFLLSEFMQTCILV